jgi:glycolate oxidase FAD binding subunit
VAGTPVPVRGAAGIGVVHAALPGDLPVARVAGILDAVRMVLCARGGSCEVLTAPEPLRGELDLWGRVPGLDLMRRVKERFDPQRLLSPGRFVGGI